MFERFTDRARRSVVLAQEEAVRLGHNYIGTEHLLLGLVREETGVAAKALEALGISLEAVRARVEEIIGRGEGTTGGHIPFTPRAKKVLELALREALQLGHNYIGTEHVLLGLVREGEGVAAQVLVQLGAEKARVRQQVIQLLSGYAQEAQPGGALHGPAQLPAGVLATPGEAPLGVEWPRLLRVVPLAQEVPLPDGERLVLISLEIWSTWMTLRSALVAKAGSTLALAPEVVLSYLVSDAAGTHYEFSGGASSGMATLRFQQAVFQPTPPAGTETLSLTAFGVRDKELATFDIELGGSAEAEGAG
jgi:hypothetical protein